MQECQTLFSTKILVFTTLVRENWAESNFHRTPSLQNWLSMDMYNSLLKTVTINIHSQCMWNADKTNESVFFNFSKIYDYSSGVCGIGIEHVN